MNRQTMGHCDAARCAALLLTALTLHCSSSGSAGSNVANLGGAAGAHQTSGATGGISVGATGGISVGATGGTSAGATAGGASGGGASQRASGGAAGSSGGDENGGSLGGESGAGGNGGGGRGSAGSGAGPTVGVPKNPVLPGLNADPQIALFGGKFYIYPTTDGFANWLSTSFHAFSSTDLVNWKDEGVILDLGPDVSFADNRAWAPGIALKNGVYYFYFSANLQIGVATSTSPTGPFKDALGHPLVTTAQFGGQSIDPYAFTDDDGRSYLYFGSTSAGGHVVELNPDMISFKGTPKAIPISGYREGSLAFKRNGTYYYMWSEGDTRSVDYDVAYGTGTSPLGPFTRATVNPILHKDTLQGILGPGHHSVLALPNGDYYIAYHRFAIPGGDGMHREVCLDRLYFNADGTIAPVKPTL
jgi:Glycosyl hydrolases family 43